MVYSVELVQHANIRYREASIALARCELLSLLRTLSLDVPVECAVLGDIPFLHFEAERPLSPEALRVLRRHSGISLIAEQEGPLLRPLSAPSADYLPADLPEVLKYKGKTSATFTRMMLNTVLSLTSHSLDPREITVLDPLCGRGTTLFSALQLGMNAIGLDADHRDIREAADYFSRYLRFHGLKHQKAARAETVGKESLPVTSFTFAADREAYAAGDTRQLTLACGDTALVSGLTRRKKAHVIIADLPYGIQHAPQFGAKPESFSTLLRRALPAWRKAIVPGGALALSFNTLTLPTDTVLRLIREAGWIPCEQEPFQHLTHEVEQAVVRNVIFAGTP